MGIRNTNVGTSRFNEYDNQKTIIHELRRVKNAVDALTAAGGSAGGTPSNLQIIKTQANDLVETYTYLDPADPVNRRISTIVYSSISLGFTGLNVITETFGYAGLIGDYYVTSSTLT
jgi:hypothetical protein